MKLRIGGRALHVVCEGDGPPLLLVHGFPLSGELWSPILADLARDHRVIVPDLRGLGRSEAGPTATMADYADDLAAVLDALDERRPAVLVGMSMGGYVAFELCRRHPARWRALVLVDTRAEADSPEAAAERRATAARVRSEGSSHTVARAMAPLLFAERTGAELRERWSSIMTATDPAGTAAALEAMAARPDSHDTLARTELPLLILVGEEDAITPPAVARRMLDSAPRARLTIVVGAGHMSPVESPAQVVAALREFLEALAAPQDRR